MSLDPSLLVLIDDEVAYRLIATWPAVGRPVMSIEPLLVDAETVADRLAHAVPDLPADHPTGLATLDRWSRSSGVDVEVVAHWVPVLFDNGILGPEGTVDDQARDLVRIAGTRRLRGGGTR